MSECVPDTSWSAGKVCLFLPDVNANCALSIITVTLPIFSNSIFFSLAFNMRSQPFNLIVVYFWRNSYFTRNWNNRFFNYGLLVCDIVQSFTWIPTFRGRMLEPWSLIGRYNSFRGIWCLHLQGCTVWYCKWIPMFRKNMLLSPSWSMSTYNTTRCHSPEDHTVRIATEVKTWKVIFLSR